jgi:tetrapyrrole methylase family protein/MazG family protein
MPNNSQKATQNNKDLQDLLDTVRQLRGENGCPWDRKQNSRSLLKYLSSEFEELVQAIENDDAENICEELGDLAYLIIMYAEINESSGRFTLADVFRTVNQKLIRRHPHVFAGQTYESEEQLARQWAEIKAAEKKINSV